ncbi:MAG: cbb3-type cytochrome c oxidase subunit I, partial [Dehalococcoidia bacterium]|nr:cbb3-type cytochrome c oxidase subunit I [Dehalococcoidia bacterium]
MAIAENAAKDFQPDFRTDSLLGLKVHIPAQNLFLANAVAAVVALALAGGYAFLMGFTRVPAIGIFSQDADAFGRVFTGHGVSALILWPIFFEIAALIFLSTILLGARIWSKRLGWMAFALMIIGSIFLEVSVLVGQADVGFTAYVPLVAHPAFYLGYILFAAGALLAVVNFALTLAQARADGILQGSLPLVTYGGATAAILAVVAIASGLVALVPTYLWTLGIYPSVDPIFYRTWFWGLGHTLQYVNVTAMIVAWYALAALTFKASPINEKYTRIAFTLYIFFTVPVLGHHFLVDPTLSPAVKIFGGSLMGFGLGIPSLMHGLAILGSLEIAGRKLGATGRFGWFRKIPWGEPGMAALMVSMALFAIGGWSGTIGTTVQLNMITHNTMWVPAHLHGVVVAGTTLSFMGLSYYLIPLAARRQLFSQSMARIQPYLYGAGLFIMMMTMSWAGFLGVPRRVADISYGGASPDWFLPMNLLGIGIALAILG